MLTLSFGWYSTFPIVLSRRRSGLHKGSPPHYTTGSSLLEMTCFVEKRLAVNFGYCAVVGLGRTSYCKFACNSAPPEGWFSRPISTPSLMVWQCAFPLAFGWGGRGGMIGVDLIGQIRRAYFEQRRPIKEIVRLLSVWRATVRKVVRGR